LQLDAIWPFEELVDRRKEFLDSFSEDPEQFLSTVKFLKMMRVGRLPRVVFEFPHGVATEELSSPEGQVVYDRRWRTLFDTDVEAVYSLHRIFAGAGRHKYDASWTILYGALAPAYKVLLYGRRYYSIGEASLSGVPLLRRFEQKLRWDSLYSEPNSISDASSYFEFFNLTSAECDMCGSNVTPEEAKYVSGWTVRRNDQFVRAFSSKFSTIHVDQFLVRDWSGWLTCRNCLREFAFL
jgi:hypothetical protein